MSKYLDRVRRKYSNPAQAETSVKADAKNTEHPFVGFVSDEKASGYVKPTMRMLAKALSKKVQKDGLYWVATIPVNRHKVLLHELRYLNRLWLKAEILAAQGYHTNKSERYRSRVGNVLSQICRRSVDIWETLEAENPKLLRGEYHLIPPTELIHQWNGKGHGASETQD